MDNAVTSFPATAFAHEAKRFARVDDDRNIIHGPEAPLPR